MICLPKADQSSTDDLFQHCLLADEYGEFESYELNKILFV